MTSRLSVSVDHDKCVGCTICCQTARHVFALDNYGQSFVVDPAGDPVEVVVEAATQCPMSAITVLDVETATRLFPPP